MPFSVILILTMLLFLFLRSPFIKGLLGDDFVNQKIYKKLDKTQYHLISNISMPTLIDQTQIENLIVSQYGLFVIETKYMNGSIYGGEKRKDWTQTLPNRKFSFQNPLHQNHKHIRALAHMLRLFDDNFHSLIIFTGKSTFNSSMPKNVLNKNYIDYIKSKNTKIFSKVEVHDLTAKIKQLKVEQIGPGDTKQVAYLRQPYRT